MRPNRDRVGHIYNIFSQIIIPSDCWIYAQANFVKWQNPLLSESITEVGVGDF